MKKKRSSLHGSIPAVPEQKIYLNVNALEEGEYELTIINKNKTIKTTTFRK
jgi:hypothetical protein